MAGRWSSSPTSLRPPPSWVRHCCLAATVLPAATGYPDDAAGSRVPGSEEPCLFPFPVYDTLRAKATVGSEEVDSVSEARRSLWLGMSTRRRRRHCGVDTGIRPGGPGALGAACVCRRGSDALAPQRTSSTCEKSDPRCSFPRFEASFGKNRAICISPPLLQARGSQWSQVEAPPANAAPMKGCESRQ